MATLATRLLRSATSRRRRRLAAAIIRTTSPVLPAVDPPRDPIFIVGSPRSGTTMLFSVLDRSPEVSSLERESHVLWDLFHREATGSQATPPQAITPRERRTLHWLIGQIAGSRRYLDKAPRNSLQIPYLRALFPGAWFVFLKRDGRAVVSSLITGWQTDGGLFPGRAMGRPLSIRGYTGETWKFVVPEGWEAYASGHTLPQVCAFQWRASTEAILAARDAAPRERWVEVAYEEFVRSPAQETRRLLEHLQLQPAPQVLEMAADLERHVVKAVTGPRPDKWRQEHPDEIEDVLPLIRPTMDRLGYRI